MTSHLFQRNATDAILKKDCRNALVALLAITFLKAELATLAQWDAQLAQLQPYARLAQMGITC